MNKELKIFSFAFAILMLFSVCACKKDKEPLSTDRPTQSQTDLIEKPTDETPEEPPAPENPAPEPQIPNVPTPTPNPPAPENATVGPYTITDPNNARGLSNQSFGFSYGIAKDGQPHSTSVNNQKKFDSYTNIEALALDTVSNDKCMYLTFDCGYEYQNLTLLILDTLKAKNVKAAFFCTLDYIKKNPQIVRRMIDEGHIVGNHSASHPSFPKLTRINMAKEIYEVEKYLKDNFNYFSPYFRFPSGEHSENALELVSSMGYKSIFWSAAHKDWETANQPTTQAAVETVTSRYHNGAVILLHAVSKANTDGLAQMIDIAAQQGYTFKSLDEYYNTTQ